MIPPGFIQDLLSRLDIVEVVGRHVDLKKAGSTHKGLCPFHGEKSPSFCVTPSRQTYHCFGCGVHGNAIGFLMEYTGAGFVEAVEDLAQQAGMVVPEDQRSAEEREKAKDQKARQATLGDVLEKAARHYKAALKSTPRAIDYLKGRGLTGEIAAQFALGYSPEGWRTLASAFPEYDDPLLVESGMVIEGDDDKRYDRFRDRIMFPIRNVKGEFIGFGGRVLDKGEPKYLNSPETPVFIKGRELYGLFEGRVGLRKRGYALVVEGYMDVVALAQHGFGNAVATLGTACTAEHVQKLFRFTESVIFSFDGDAAGRRAAGRALEAALPHATDTRSIKFLFLPTEHDPDSYVREFGAAGFERYVEQAIPLSRQLQESASEGCDLATVEGRARMLSNAKPLWSALPEGLLKRGTLAELARRAQLPDTELMRMWQVAGAPSAAPEGEAAAPARKEWKKDWKPSGDWKSRREPKDPTAGLPRRQPLSPADLALRMLLLEPSWWEQLGHEDQQMLHELPGAHGELVQWLERYLVNHGPAAWPVLESALSEDGLIESAQRFTAGALAGEDLIFDDFAEALRKVLRSQLEARSKALAAAGDLAGYKLVHDRLRELDALARVDAAEK